MSSCDINDLWIPMSRKKPEILQKCLISTKKYGVAVGIFLDDGLENEIFSYNEHGLKGRCCKYYFDCETLHLSPWYTMSEVDAWMPFPTTYTKKGAKR